MVLCGASAHHRDEKTIGAGAARGHQQALGRLQRGGGWLHPAVIVNGRAVGAWRLAGAGPRQELRIEPFEKLSRAVQAGIEAEARDISRFLDFPLETKIAEPA